MLPYAKFSTYATALLLTCFLPGSWEAHDVDQIRNRLGEETPLYTYPLDGFHTSFVSNLHFLFPRVDSVLNRRG